jgi:hypothetical protein
VTAGITFEQQTTIVLLGSRYALLRNLSRPRS